MNLTTHVGNGKGHLMIDLKYCLNRFGELMKVVSYCKPVAPKICVNIYNNSKCNISLIQIDTIIVLC